MIVISHNLLAMNAQRQLGINMNRKVKTAEKLSSGYRINRSSDDAAGLSISEKMRRQVRGLYQAGENIQDGISLIQVADGALNETQALLQRMNELAVQAANGTNTNMDREYIQAEIDQLVSEVDRIANDTSFNEDIYPLLGTGTVGNTNNFQKSLPAYLWIQEFSVVNTTGQDVQWDGKTYHPGETINGKCIVYDASLNTSSTWPKKYVVYKGAGAGMQESANRDSMPDFGADALKLAKGRGGGYSITGWGTDSDGVIYFDTSDGRKVYYGVSSDGNTSKVGVMRDSKYDSYFKVKQDGNNNMVSQSVWIQMGTEVNQGMYIDLVDATVGKLGIANVDVTSQDNAGTAISTINNAINTVSKYRSTFGAQQNRLEHGYNSNKNTEENTIAAESRIRDADMAEEMMQFSKDNILEQVAQSMLAQANQSVSGILSLLQ